MTQKTLEQYRATHNGGLPMDEIAREIAENVSDNPALVAAAEAYIDAWQAFILVLEDHGLAYDSAGNLEKMKEFFAGAPLATFPVVA